MDKEITDCKISIVQTPTEIQKALASIAKLLTKEMASNRDWDYKSGNLPIPNLPRPLSIYFDIWLWINDINEIIENINLVLGDLKMLRDNPNLFQESLSGNPIVRYKLLTRTFFYEFFRFKECFNEFLGRLVNAGLLNSQVVKGIKSEFYKQFETAIKVRNTMIHSRYPWPGEPHLRLFVASSAESMGGALVDKETGAVIETVKVLSELAREAIQTIGAIIGESIGENRASRFLGSFFSEGSNLSTMLEIKGKVFILSKLRDGKMEEAIEALEKALDRDLMLFSVGIYASEKTKKEITKALRVTKEYRLKFPRVTNHSVTDKAVSEALANAQN